MCNLHRYNKEDKPAPIPVKDTPAAVPGKDTTVAAAVPGSSASDDTAKTAEDKQDAAVAKKAESDVKKAEAAEVGLYKLNPVGP